MASLLEYPPHQTSTALLQGSLQFFHPSLWMYLVLLVRKPLLALQAPHFGHPRTLEKNPFSLPPLHLLSLFLLSLHLLLLLLHLVLCYQEHCLLLLG